jgi:hypothetical protein
MKREAVAKQHAELVDAWLERTAARLSPVQQIALFERALAALWERARQTLGELTLTAIVERVLSTATEKHPILAGARLDAGAVSCEVLRRDAEALSGADAREALRCVLVEWLTVVGNLTAEILTPALHEALSKVEKP